MKQIPFPANRNDALLMDELFAQIPELVYEHPRRGRSTDAFVSGGVLHVPDSVDTSKVLAVFQAHDPTQKNANQRAREERRTRLERIDTMNVEELRAVVKELYAHVFPEGNGHKK